MAFWRLTITSRVEDILGFLKFTNPLLFFRLALLKGLFFNHFTNIIFK